MPKEGAGWELEATSIVKGTKNLELAKKVADWGASKGASELVRQFFFSNMSTRAAETLREDLESRGPVRLSEVEAEQKEMLKVVRRLIDEGQIVMAGGGDDGFV